MGMYDESWCDSCGTSQPYSENDVTCGSCVADELESFMSGVFVYLNNMQNELEERIQLSDEADATYNYLEGAVETVIEIQRELNERFRNA